MLDKVFEAKKVFNSKKGVDTEFLKFFKLYLGQVNPRDFDIKDKEKKKERIQAFIDNIPKDFKSFVAKNNTIEVDALNAINEKIDKIVAGGTAEHYQPETSNVHDLVAEIVGERKKREDLEREKESIRAYMEKEGLKSWECAGVKMTRILATTRTTLDSKKVKELYPEAYDACLKVAEVKESLKITRTSTKS